MSHRTIPLLTASLLLLSSCSGEDRSGEQPFPPTVVMVGANADAGRLTLEGLVTASPNSSLTVCGFRYGNDTMKKEIKCDEPLERFAAQVDSVPAGHYYAVAFATNRMGSSESDTLRFYVNSPF